ncbi:hypothetical protein SLE2022_376300 [Rubroshorea leprosula]
MKLNTDGSSLGNPGPYGAGGIFRDHHGNWIVGHSRNVGIAPSLTAELWAIRDGLRLAVDKGFHDIIVESDSKAAVLLLSKNFDSLHYLSTLLDCRNLMQ